MLEPPAVPKGRIATCLQEGFGLKVEALSFLPLGADLNTALYRLIAADGAPYFVKLRRGFFDEMSVLVPRFLHEQDIAEVIPPLETTTGSPWAELDAFKVILYPYVDGHNGYEAELSRSQWIELGNAFKRLHAVHLPDRLIGHIRRENWSPVHRESLHKTMQVLEGSIWTDPLAGELCDFLNEQRRLILDLIEQTNDLAHSLQNRSFELCLCHGDLHAGNLLIHAKGDFYIVDWDDLILAPREKDLMSVGAGLFGGWRSPAEQVELFYQGYGSTELDQNALNYYRRERIIADLAVECRQIFGPEGSGEDRQQAFQWLKSNFEPDGCIALARQAH